MNKFRKIHICYRDSTSVTANRLADDLQDLLKVEVTRGEKAVKGALNISWGYQDLDKVNFILNHPKAIRETVNKLKFNDKLDKKGVLVSKSYCPKDIIKLYKSGKVNTPLIARINKMQNGNGFRVCMCLKQIEGAIKDKFEYFKEYIKPKDEWRVHIFRGKAILVIKKDYDTPYRVSRFDEDEFIVTKDINPMLIKTAQQAISISSLDFGAVDVLEGEDGKFYVLEINSAPAMDKAMRRPYLEAIKKVLPKEALKKTGFVKRTFNIFRGDIDNLNRLRASLR